MLADSSKVQLGEPVMAMGNPFGLERAVRREDLLSRDAVRADPGRSSRRRAGRCR